MKLAFTTVAFIAIMATCALGADDKVHLSPDTVAFAMTEGLMTTVSPSSETAAVTGAKYDKHDVEIKTNVNWLDVEDARYYCDCPKCGWSGEAVPGSLCSECGKVKVEPSDRSE